MQSCYKNISNHFDQAAAVGQSIVDPSRWCISLVLIKIPAQKMAKIILDSLMATNEV